MAKKSKDRNKSSKHDPENNSIPNSGNNVFETLFGSTPEDATAASIFSDANPFRRKASDSFQTSPNKKIQVGLGLGFAEDSIENPKFGASDSGADDLNKKKKKKEKKRNFDADSIDVEGEESKKLKKDGENAGTVSPKIASNAKDGEERKRTSEYSQKTPKRDAMSKKEGKGSPNPGLEAKLKLEKEIGITGKLGVGTVGNEKKKKRKRDEIEAEYEKKLYGQVGEEGNEEKVNKEATVMVGEKRKKMDNPEELMVSKEGFDDENKLLRTVFVGNLPLKIKKKVLIKEFGKFGEVESVRIRSIPLVDTKTPRKGAILKKQINESADSVHAYIVFKTEDAAQGSLEHNMAVIGGNHIRVDRACPPRKKLKGDSAPLYDSKRTVFVGNLPFDVKDEELYQLFTGMNDLKSSIEAVRVIRDPNTSLGKGIAYVLFKTRDAVSAVVKKRNLKLRDRELRVYHAKSNPTPSKSKNVSPGRGLFPSKTFAEDSRTSGSNNNAKAKATMSYQGLRASKSGVVKKAQTEISQPGNVKAKTQKTQNSMERKRKRPAVAARKAKALKTSPAIKQGGMKRKLEHRTPDSVHQKKKARKNR